MRADRIQIDTKAERGALSGLGTRLKVTGIAQTVLPAQVPPGATVKSAVFGPLMLWLSVSVNGERLVTFSVLNICSQTERRCQTSGSLVRPSPESSAGY